MTVNESLTGLLVGLGIFLVILVLIVIAVAVVCLIGNYKFYTKAGVEGWKAIIPFYNTWVLVEIAGLNWYWFLLIIAQSIFAIVSGIIPFLGYFTWVAYLAMIIGNVALFINLSKKLHKDTGWVVCGVIFGSIVTAIAGFDKKTEFDNTVVVSKDSIFEKYLNKNNQTNTPNVNNEAENKEN
ncbi:MAG: hypothetical protein J1F35_02925 [Erysipelotrichales bacterium]|nr:hypothetical protein [Erysipelotrichales bacterium]